LENFEMKKSLVALAALAASSAFAQFSIDGIWDIGYTAIDYKGAAKVSGINGNGSSTSQINLRGKENLGGGLSADFRYETDWTTYNNRGNTGTVSNSVTAGNGGGAASNVNLSSWGNGEIRGGIAGGFGRLDAGNVNSAQLTALLVGQPLGTAIGSSFRGQIVNDTSGLNSVRFENSLRYTSPSLSGISATIYNVTKQTKAGTGVAGDEQFNNGFGLYDRMGVNEYSVNYNNGPINATYAVTKQDYASVGANTFTTQLKSLGANYDVGNGFKVFAFNQKRTKSDGSVNRNFTLLTGQYTMGAHVVSVGTGSGTENGTGRTNSGESKLTSLAYDYNLSKMTAIYVRNESIKDDGNWVANSGVLPTATNSTRVRTAVGLRIGF
jgi:predicted porin